MTVNKVWALLALSLSISVSAMAALEKTSAELVQDPESGAYVIVEHTQDGIVNAQAFCGCYPAPNAPFNNPACFIWNTNIGRCNATGGCYWTCQ